MKCVTRTWLTQTLNPKINYGRFKGKKMYRAQFFLELGIVLARLELKNYIKIAWIRYDLLCNTAKFSVPTMYFHCWLKALFTTVLFIGIKMMSVSDSCTIAYVSVPLNATTLNVLKTQFRNGRAGGIGVGCIALLGLLFDSLGVSVVSRTLHKTGISIFFLRWRPLFLEIGS